MSTEQIFTPNNVVAASMFSLPLWLPTLDEMSVFAAKVTPILGGMWLLLQLSHFVWTKYIKDSRDA